MFQLRFAILFTAIVWFAVVSPSWVTADDVAMREYQSRVEAVRGTPGFVALWDFVHRDQSTGQFSAHQPIGSQVDLRLNAVNYVRDYWGVGRPSNYDDFPLLGRGPFGQAVQIRAETDADFRPCLVVPRERLHGSGLDVKGPGRSVSMVAWVIRQSGNHAIAGIWHEGTDLNPPRGQVIRVEQGRRQYALFAGLAANDGASAVHVSENGGSSFGDKYARNLAVTPNQIPTVSGRPSENELDRAWSMVGFVFDHANHTMTAYLDGEAMEYWIENPREHRFFKWPAQAWLQAKLHRTPGLQDGEDPNFPPAQFYEPPEDQPLGREVVYEHGNERVELHSFRFTRVRVTLGRDTEGAFSKVKRLDLAALKVNPFWFPHDIYAPDTKEEGGPFTIGRVIHSGRSVGFTGYIGGVAVFDRAIDSAHMKRLAGIGKRSDEPDATPDLLRFSQLDQLAAP